MATIELTKENFASIIESNEIVLLDFWASWCGPCKAFGPVFEKVSDKHPEITFGKVDTEAQPEIAGAFGIRSIPTLVVFREQIGLLSQPGALSEEALDDVVSQVKALDMAEVRAELAKHQAEHSHGCGCSCEHDHDDE
jgi:thioredoxin 1